jgi:hypothetical protein
MLMRSPAFGDTPARRFGRRIERSDVLVSSKTDEPPPVRDLTAHSLGIACCASRDNLPFRWWFPVRPQIPRPVPCSREKTFLIGGKNFPVR